MHAGGLARIFHTDSAAACEHLMDTASASNCSSGSMKHTAVVAIHHLPYLHQDSRRLATNQYELSGLARIFHTDHLRRPGSQMDVALDSHCDLDSMDTYSPASKCSSALTRLAKLVSPFEGLPQRAYKLWAVSTAVSWAAGGVYIRIHGASRRTSMKYRGESNFSNYETKKHLCKPDAFYCEQSFLSC